MRPVALVSLLLLLGGGASCAWVYRQYDAPGPLPNATPAAVPRGGLGEVTTALAAAGVVGRAPLFRLYAALTARAGPLHAGEFAFPASASPREVLAILRTARPLQHRLTIPEGLTAAQVARLAAAADALVGEATVPQEGSVLPDTYSYDRGTSREQLLDRGRVAMNRALDAAWQRRRPGLPLASRLEALTLASLVERETARADERPLVAAVFLNRLTLGMRLQSDATVAYVASGGSGAMDHGITRAELDRDDPYNTYRIAGLPPAPICMPGLAALRAATEPAVTDALYFVADGTGGHVFSHTVEEHNRNVLHWREIERARAAPIPARAPG